VVASRILVSLFALRVTLAYCAALAVVAVALLVLGPDAQNSVVARMSTNLHNLKHGRLDTLFGSAFVTDGGLIFASLPGLVCLLAVAELLLHGRRVVLAFLLGHVGATLIVAVGLAVAIHMGWLPTGTARATDVGISYGVAAVLGALTAAIPNRWRAAWTGWWIAIAVLVAMVNKDFTSVGHTLALMLGVVLSWRFGSPAGWTPTRLGLLAAGAWFGYLVIDGASVPIAPVVGLAGAVSAVLAQRLVVRWRSAEHAGHQPRPADDVHTENDEHDRHQPPAGPLQHLHDPLMRHGQLAC